MEHTLSELDKLNSLINLEKHKYMQAIKHNQNLEDAKVIYLTIKELEERAHVLMQNAVEKLSGQVK